MKKLFANKKIVLGVMTSLMILAIIAVSSFFPFILDPEKLNTTEFITNQLILYAIILSSITSMVFIAQASNAGNPNSELAKAKVAFSISIKRITNYTFFFQWVKKVMQPNDRKDVAEKEMLRLGIDYKVYELSDEEIMSLEKPQRINNVFFKKLTKKQISEVIALKKHVKKIKMVSPNYYVSYQSFSSEKNLSEIASSEIMKKVSTIALNMVSKLITTFVGAFILGSLVLDLTQDPTMVAGYFMTFLSRMFCFISSSFSGYMLGCKINDLDAFYITKRIEAHKLYLEDTNFKPVDEAKQEFIDRVKEETILIGGVEHE